MTLWTVAHQVPLSMRFSRHEYCSGLLHMYKHTYKEDLFFNEEMTHMIMKAEKFHDILSANWRTRNTGGGIQSPKT